MVAELSPAQKCRRNKWNIGCVLKVQKLRDLEKWELQYWKITAIGEYAVLGRRVNLPERTASGEEIIPFCNPNYFSWRIWENRTFKKLEKVKFKFISKN